MLLSQAFLATIGLFASYAAAANYATNPRLAPDAPGGSVLSSIWIKFNVKGGGDRDSWYNIGYCYDLNGKPNIQGYEIRASSSVEVTLRSDYSEGGSPLTPDWNGPTDGQRKWGPQRVGSFCVYNRR